MNRYIFPYFTTKTYLIFLRVLVGLIMMSHGTARLYYNSIEGFGEFLNSKGIPFGFFLAASITLYDISGGLILTLGFLKKWISLGFIVILISGIFLVHIQNGWFVVGHQSGGIEYSVTLIFCLLSIASSNREEKTIHK